MAMGVSGGSRWTEEGTVVPNDRTAVLDLAALRWETTP